MDAAAQRIIGVLGVGRMGAGVCATLVRAGLTVWAWDARAERRMPAALAGAQWAASPGDLGRRADVLVTVLPGSAELAEAMAGVLPALRSGTTWIDLTSADPRVAAPLQAQAAAGGIDALESPMGGGPTQAAAGGLILFVGGPAETVARQRALLEALGHVEHVGGHGSGYTVKLLVNLLWFGHAVATSEALLLARRSGLDLDTVQRALARSAADSRFVHHDVAALRDGDYLTDFGLDRCVEELDAITALAAEQGTPAAVSQRVAQTYREALERFGPVDGELLAVALLEEQAGVSLRREGTQS